MYVRMQEQVPNLLNSLYSVSVQEARAGPQPYEESLWCVSVRSKSRSPTHWTVWLACRCKKQEQVPNPLNSLYGVLV